MGQRAVHASDARSNNVAIGSFALVGNVEGSNNVAIGFHAGLKAPLDVQNSAAIGANTQITGSNMIRLGDDNIKVISGQVQITAASDYRLKEDIQPLDSASRFIMKLHPVSYRMKNPADTRRNWGFIAQDIESLLGTNNAILTVGGDADRTLGLRYTDFIAPMVKTIQEQQEVINDLKLQNQTLRAQVESEDGKIKSQIANLKAEFAALLKKLGDMAKLPGTSKP
jgi:hypothetical protein